MDNDCSSLNLVALHPLMEVATEELRLNQNNFIPVIQFHYLVLTFQYVRCTAVKSICKKSNIKGFIFGAVFLLIFLYPECTLDQTNLYEVIIGERSGIILKT